jgi:hypothetical protein
MTASSPMVPQKQDHMLRYRKQAMCEDQDEAVDLSAHGATVRYKEGRPTVAPPCVTVPIFWVYSKSVDPWSRHAHVPVQSHVGVLTPLQPILNTPQFFMLHFRQRCSYAALSPDPKCGISAVYSVQLTFHNARGIYYARACYNYSGGDAR